ncbi:hypothetical protein HZY88_05670 [Aerococcaceae bacterium DSM 111176]|nr:hypothetical protein [Aerococcaceae bacterium DSM 111176]
MSANLPLPNKVYDEMLKLRERVIDQGEKLYKKWVDSDTKNRSNLNKLNLCYYLTLRSIDIRPLQEDLVLLGLSTLGRAEAHILESINAIIASLERIVGKEDPLDYPDPDDFLEEYEQLSANTKQIFGSKSERGHAGIIVTLSSDYSQKDITKLVKNGMDIARINCGHDSPEIWQDMVNMVNKGAKENNKKCRIFYDLAGPKIRIQWLLSSSNQQKINIGDTYLLTGNSNINISPDYHFQVGISVPEILDAVDIGEPILIDDGSIAGEVVDRNNLGLIVKVTRVTKSNGVRLKTEKGINFPQTDIELPIITQKDKKDLEKIIDTADIIGVSFVKSVDDIQSALEIIQQANPNKDNIPIVAKIETNNGVKRLPDIILSIPDDQPFGVMIARGDLAVETGFMRLGELQQEILWICQAANIPVIWATQILESLAKTGTPTRSEITDITDGAARADSVMLNKGPYINDAVIFLSELLLISSENTYKKTPRLRALNIAKRMIK